MSFGIHTQTTVTLTDLTLFTEGAEDVCQQEGEDSLQPNSQGELKTGSKPYVFTFKENAPLAKEMLNYLKAFTLKHSAEQTDLPQGSNEKNSSLFSLSAAYSQAKRPVGAEKQYRTEPKREKNSEGRPESSRMQAKEQPQTASKMMHQPASNESKLARTPQHARENSQSERLSGKLDQRQRSEQNALAERQVIKEETKQWWEARHQQKERQGGQQREQQDQQHDEDEKKMRIAKSATSSSRNASISHVQKEQGVRRVRKPELDPPKIGIYALYYILTKMGIWSDGVSNFNYKKEIEHLDLETTETHKKRLEEVKEAIKREKETERWGVATKVFSWLASLFAIIAGIALIATGVGAIAGAMLVAGGIIQVSSQIMEVTGGWQKVAALLPGEDTEKKRAVVTWMQIGIAVLCLILSGAGIIWGGYASFGQAMNLAMGVLGGIASIGFGITTIGEGVTNFFYKNHLSDVKKFDVQLARLKNIRKDLMEKMEWGVDRLEQLFEDLARSLEFEEELFQADQMVNHR